MPAQQQQQPPASTDRAPPTTPKRMELILRTPDHDHDGGAAPPAHAKRSACAPELVLERTPEPRQRATAVRFLVDGPVGEAYVSQKLRPLKIDLIRLRRPPTPHHTTPRPSTIEATLHRLWLAGSGDSPRSPCELEPAACRRRVQFSGPLKLERRQMRCYPPTPRHQASAPVTSSSWPTGPC